MKYTIIGLLALGLISCNKEIRHREAYNTIDSTHRFVTSIIAEIDTISQDSMFMYNKELDLYYQQILGLRNDTDFRPLWKEDIADINFCRKHSKHFINNSLSVRGSYIKSLTQLSNLRHDLENNLVNDSNVTLFVHHETNLVKKINKAYFKRVQRGIDCYVVKDSIFELTNNVLTQLKNERLSHEE